MYLLYIDESGDPGPRGSDYLVLGGAALFEGKWRNIEEEIRQLIDRYFPSDPKPTEIRLAELNGGKGRYGTLDAATRRRFVQEYCNLASGLLATELVLFTVIAEKKHCFAANPGKTGD